MSGGQLFALLDRAQNGDDEACEQVLLENSGLIWSIVRRYYGCGVETDDLYQLGCIGFIKAVKGFDLTYGTQFSTYAVPKIAGEIRRFLRDNGAIKVGRSIREKGQALAAARGRVLPKVTDFCADDSAVHRCIHAVVHLIADHADRIGVPARFCATKLIEGGDDLADRLALISRTEGAALSPFDAFLIQRGMKTLALRMEKHQQNARAVAAFLKDHPSVAEVFWPGDEDSPDYALSCSQSTGFGGMLSFALKTREQALSLLENVKLIKFAESLGGTESLITYPLTQTHASTPAPLREKLGITDRLVRLSVGIEQENDIIGDLFVALRA